MLIGFKLKNFRSFLGEQIFSFATSSDRTYESTHCVRTGMKTVPRLAKSAALFGANASGKTNLFVALATLRDLILHSTGYSAAQLKERYTPFQFGPSARRSTEFEIDVLLEGTRYRYSMAYDADRVLYERLLVYRTGKAQRWFERHFDRDAQRDDWAPFSPHFHGPREMWRKATRAKALFLTAAAQLNSEQLAPLVSWVEHSLEIVFPADLSDGNRVAAQLQNEDFKHKIVSLFRAVDMPITDVRITDPDATHGYFAPHTGTSSPPIEFLYTRDPWTPVWLNACFEASGTHRLFALLGPLLTAMERGKLLVIDEFDRNLHPLIARFLIRLMNDPAVSKHNAQLLAISHNNTLMDLDILRRDQIWLVQLGPERASSLSPLSRSDTGKRDSIAKSYLRGRYGAVPLIQSDVSEDNHPIPGAPETDAALESHTEP